MLGRGADMRAALIRGVDPELESEVSDIGAHMQVGSFNDLIAGEQHIILGAGLAYALDARVGDEITRARAGDGGRRARA